MSQMGPVPVQAQMEVKDLAEAIKQFPEAIAEAIEEMVAEAKERQRESANRIVVPGGMPGGLPGAGAPPGGGKIQLG